eukprot:2645198-Amphidinium_carterae.2
MDSAVQSMSLHSWSNVLPAVTAGSQPWKIQMLRREWFVCESASSLVRLLSSPGGFARWKQN